MMNKREMKRLWKIATDHPFFDWLDLKMPEPDDYKEEMKNAKYKTGKEFVDAIRKMIEHQD